MIVPISPAHASLPLAMPLGARLSVGNTGVAETRADERRALIGQIIRYAITGGIVTQAAIMVYLFCVYPLGMAPLVANLLGYLVAVALGYVLHSRFSFRDPERRDDLKRTGSRFLLVSLVSFGLNSLWVWVTTDLLAWPEWTPTPLMLGVTPALVFVLNRMWVFR